MSIGSAPAHPQRSAFIAGSPHAEQLVVLCHPLGGSARFDPDPVVTRGTGIALLAVDRPGYGGSAVPPAQGDAPIGDRLQEVLDGVARYRATVSDEAVPDRPFHLVGWGVGALVAAAVVQQQPDLVGRVALVNPHRPPPPSRSTYRAGIEDLVLTEVSAGADRDLARDPGLEQRVRAMVHEGSRQGRAGAVIDQQLLESTALDLDLTALRGRARLWMGMRCPGAAAEIRWWRRRVGDLPVVTAWNSGPFVLATRWGAILDDLLAPGA